MKFYLPFFSFLVLFLGIPCVQTQAQTDWVKKIQLSEKYYEDGQYQEALDVAQKATEKAKRNGKGYVAMNLSFYIAKYYEALGNFEEFEEAIRKMQSLKQKQGKENSKGEGFLKEAWLHAEYGNPSRSAAYLSKAKNTLGEVLNASYYQRLYLEAQLANQAQRGSLDSALQTLESLRKVTEASFGTGTQDLFLEQEGKVVAVEADRRTTRRRRIFYGKLMAQKSELLRKKGDLEAAKEALEKAKSWVRGQLGTQQEAYLHCTFNEIKLREQHGAPRGEIRNALEKLLYAVERELGFVHKFYFKVQEELITFYLEEQPLKKRKKNNLYLGPVTDFVIDPFLDSRYNVRADKQGWDMRLNASRYFGKEKVKHATAKRLEALYYFQNRRIGRAKELLAGLFKDASKLPKTHPEYLAALQLKYRVLLAEDNYSEALACLNEIIQTAEAQKGKNTLYLKELQLQKAQHLLRFTSRFTGADSLITQAMPALEAAYAPQSTPRLRLENLKAEALMARGKYGEAVEVYRAGWETQKRQFGEQHIATAIQLQHVVEALLAKGELTDASAKVDTLIQVFEAESNASLNKKYAKALETAAGYYASMGLYSEAQSYLLKAQRRFRRSSSSIANSTGQDALAALYIEMERYDEAEQILERTLEIREERFGTESRFLIPTLVQLAKLTIIYGDFTKAYDFITRAMKLAKEEYTENSIVFTNAQEVEADYYSAIGDYERATTILEKVIAKREEMLNKTHISVAQALNRLALVRFYAEVPWEELEPLLTRAAEIVSENLGKKSPVYAENLKNAALIYTDLGEPEKALANLREALSIWESLDGEKSANAAEIQVLLAEALLRIGSFAEALENIEKSKKTYKKILGKEHRKYIAAMSKEAQIYYESGDLKNAIKRSLAVTAHHKNYFREYFPVLSDREKTKYWNLIRSDFEFLANLAFHPEAPRELASEVYNNTLITKSLLLSASIKIRSRILSSGNDSLISNYNRWQGLKAELIQVIALSQEQQKEIGVDPRAIEKEIEALEKSLSRQANFFSSEEEEPTVEDITASLKPDEYAIEMIRYRHFSRSFSDSAIYAALVVEHGQKDPPKVIFFEKGNKMETKFIKFYRNAIEFQMEDLISYKNFWKPIGNLIPEGKRIYLSAEGVYHQLNLETLLVNPAEGKYLLDRNAIILVTSTKDLVEEEQSNDELPQDIVIIGDPVFGGDVWSQLPGAQEEAKTIATALREQGEKVDVKLQEEATEDYVKSLKSPKILHMATHGFFVPDIEQETKSVQQNTFRNPLLRSGLLLKDGGLLMDGNNVHEFNKASGVLTAYEVASLNFDNTLLVGLSACETSKGDLKVGEGVYGLQRAFRVAGVKTLIMSLFKVDDEATKQLMQMFYENWNQTGDKRQAFADAKKKLRENFPEPYYWGAFIMVGEN